MGRGPPAYPQTPEQKQTLPERADGSIEAVRGVGETSAYFLLLTNKWQPASPGRRAETSQIMLVEREAGMTGQKPRRRDGHQDSDKPCLGRLSTRVKDRQRLTQGSRKRRARISHLLLSA